MTFPAVLDLLRQGLESRSTIVSESQLQTTNHRLLQDGLWNLTTEHVNARWLVACTEVQVH